MNREIKYIVIHCTATPQHATVESILSYWKNSLGWKNPGYHCLIEPNGKVNYLLSILEASNGVAGYNSSSIHISYIGGIDRQGKAFDNRTQPQIISMLMLIKMFKELFPAAEILGHRDFPSVKKDCPSFDVKTWLAQVGIIN